MSSRNNANINKIARLSYVIIFSLLSYYIFLENIYGNNSVYDKVQNVVHKSITNHWYKRCSTTSRKSDCKGYHVKILISGQWMEAKNESVYQYRARAKFNKERKPSEYKFVLFDDTYRALDKSYAPTLKIVWGLFLLTLPLIWFSRGFSIPTVNSIMKLFNKGWKKL